MPPSLGQPPLPPQMAGAAAPQSQPPSMMQLAGMQGGAGQTPTPGMSQISESVVRMGSEIDQAIKLLAQAVPQLAPWAEKTVMELRYQIGMALQSGNVPTDPTAAGNEQFPTGEGRM